jgi:hypothetical protein
VPKLKFNRFDKMQNPYPQSQHPLHQALTHQLLPEIRVPDSSLDDELMDVQVSEPKNVSGFKPAPLALSVIEESGRKKREKASHRIFAYMYASGATYKHIAQENNTTPETVRKVLDQPEYRALVAELIHENHNDDIGKILKAGALEAVQVIRAMANDPKTPDAVRLRANMDLLDRYRGKPTQHTISSTGMKSDNPEQEIEQLKKELDAV